MDNEMVPNQHQKVTDSDNLATIASAINEEHALAEQYASMAIHRARRAGELLNQAKAQVPHGQWLPWLAANCPKISTRRAQEYMRVVREWPALQAKYAESAHLTVNDALELLAKPKPEPLPITAATLATPSEPVLEPHKQDSPFEKINQEHRQYQAKARESDLHKLNMGKLLLAVKADMNSDQWTAWLAEQQQSGAMAISVYEVDSAMRKAENAIRKAAEHVELLKSLWLSPSREFLLSLVTEEEARGIRQHWLVKEADRAQEWVDRTVKELRADQDMPNWLKSDSLTRALEKAERAKRKVEGRSLELTDTETHALWEQAKAIMATTEGSAAL